MVDTTAESSHHHSRELCGLLVDFSNGTTMHGIRRAVGSNDVWRRVVWTLLVLSGMTWAVYQLVGIIREYYRYPVSTLVSTEYSRKMLFPAVTICNLNRLRMSKLDGRLRFLKRPLPMNQHKEYMTMLIREYSKEERIARGHVMEDMFVACTFNLEPCTDKDFIEEMYMKSGNCYTFGDTVREKKERYTNKAGPANGLILDLDIGRSEYLRSSSAYGVNIILHNGSEFAFPFDGGMVAGPGFSTSIALRKVESSLLPSPYGMCVESNSVSQKHNLFSRLGYSYTELACQRSCYQVKLLTECRCYDDDVPGGIDDMKTLAGISESEKNFSFCDSSYRACLDRVNHLFDREELGCTDMCPPACNKVYYLRSATQAEWPVDEYYDHVIRKVNSSYQAKNKTYAFIGEPRDHVRKNFLRLEIYYESLEYEVKKTIPTYDWNKVLSDVGGQLGLWIGFSILTAVELVEFGLNIFLFLFGKVFKTGQMQEAKRNL